MSTACMVIRQLETEAESRIVENISPLALPETASPAARRVASVHPGVRAIRRGSEFLVRRDRDRRVLLR
jgi:hypothetical protein